MKDLDLVCVLKISFGCPKASFVFLQHPKDGIASTAQQSAQAAVSVVVVNAQVF